MKLIIKKMIYIQYFLKLILNLKALLYYSWIKTRKKI